MVRRLKSELVGWDGAPVFPRRVLKPIEVDYPEEERRVHAALKEYTKARTDRVKEDKRQAIAAQFVLKTLKKRLFSSPQAFLSTLEKHEQTIKRPAGERQKTAPTIGILRREIDREGEDYAQDEDREAAINDALDAASRTFSEPSQEELSLIGEMKEWASKACSQNDAKANEIISWLNENIRVGKKWTNDRVIIFTEYRATQKWLMDVLAAEGLAKKGRLLTMYGGMDSKDRESVKAAFQASPDKSDVRILLATDAASEGLNLQNHCSKLIHYEIPWNPNRLEQRNGRVDRHGQKASEVLIHHFVAKGFDSGAASTELNDLDADLEFLMRVARKVETIREDLGSVGQVLSEDVEAAMLGGRYNLTRTDEATNKSEPVRKMLKFERDLQKQVQALKEQHQETVRELRLSPENILQVVKVGLRVAEQPELIPVEDRAGEYHMPEFRKPSWAASAEGLAHPHTGEIRPITFDPGIASGRDDVVLAHLNHRLVQNCLRLLRAEVWSLSEAKKIHRIEARVVPDSVLDTPAIVAHARLVVIGGDTHRLHEEIISAGGVINQGRFNRMGVNQIKDASRESSDREPSEAMKGKLLGLWDTVAPSLQQSLAAREKDRTKGLEKLLAERADKEASDITKILEELAAAITKELDEPEYRQLELFTDPEREQLERNKDFLRERVKQIPHEIERETAALQSRYENPQARTFPVAVSFLVPSKLANQQ